MDNLQEVWTTVKLGFTGALGGICICLLHRKNLKLLDVITYVTVGSLAAHFFTPMVIVKFPLFSGNSSGIAFLLGSCSGFIGSWAINFVVSGELTSLIKSRFGRGE